MDQQRSRIRHFFAQSLRSENFSDEEELFASGKLNSLFAVQLVLFVEREFSCVVNSDDLDMKNFSSVAAVDRFISAKNAKRRIAILEQAVDL